MTILRSAAWAFAPLALAMSLFPAQAQDVDHAAEVAALDGDADAGRKVFNKCRSCHVIDEERNRVGPHLVGVFGRPAGSVADFNYTDANRNSGVVWTAETLSEYLLDPRAYLPGTRMNLKVKAEDIPNLLAFLLRETGVHTPSE